ncbi:MAG: hypothetical protein AMXMBFR83_09220 [Phycisphaerae bacterium]
MALSDFEVVQRCYSGRRRHTASTGRGFAAPRGARPGPWKAVGIKHPARGSDNPTERGYRKERDGTAS